MNTPTQERETTGGYWAEEPASTPGRARFRARIGGLHCSLCTGTIEKALSQRPGVESVAVSLSHEQALVEYDPSRTGPEQLVDTLRDIGYTVWDPRKARPYEEEEAELVREGRRLLGAVAFSLVTIALILNVSGLWGILVPALIAAGLAGVAFAIVRSQAGTARALAGGAGLGMVVGGALALNASGGASGAVPWVVGGLALVVVFGLARHILQMAVQSARRGILNQHVLLEIGAFAGLTGGVIGLVFSPVGYPTAAFFAVSVLIVNYHIFSEWLSLLVRTRSSQAVKRLLDLQPDTARVVRGDEEHELPVAAIAVGDLFRVRPGERVPLDGEVVAGRSGVDEALVTGEPLPVDKLEGDGVIGGSINGSGTLLVRATVISDEGFLSQVIRHVEDARALKPGILHLVDRILRVYTPAVLAISVLATLAWTFGAWLLTGDPNLVRAVYAGLGVLVMGYPCAVGIAAPLSIVRGAGEAADQGIIMRTGEAFQAFRQVKPIVLDKTGTLTEGRPTVRELAATGSEQELLAVAAAAESSSEHPLARAVLDAALDRGIAVASVEDFESLTGSGVFACLDGDEVLVGRPALLAERGIDIGPLHGQIESLESAGRTVIAVARAGRPLGAIALGDRLREDAVRAVAAMRDRGLTPVLVTGDNQRAAQRMAHDAGIEHVHAGVLPDQKAEIIRDLQHHGRVAMVGDGINDAPALMQADVGVAMGGGTDIAIESADIVIVGDRLESVLEAREISAYSYRKTKQNVMLAFLFNGIGVPLATTGLIYPVWAMIAMALSVTTIFINSLWGRPSLLFDAIRSVGRQLPHDAPRPADTAAAGA